MNNVLDAKKNRLAIWLPLYAAIIFIVGIFGCVLWLVHQGNIVPFQTDHSAISINESLKNKQEYELAKKVTAVLENILGQGKIKVELNLEMSFDKIVTNQEVFDPQGKVIKTRFSEPNASSIKETVYYEVNRLTRSQVSNAGKIEKISAVILIDGIYERTPGGTIIYRERSLEEIAKLAALVEPILGFDPNRGDVLKIKNIPFAETKSFLGLFSGELIEISLLIIMILMALILLSRNRREAEASIGEKLNAQAYDIQCVEDVIDANPMAAVQIIREWLADSNRDNSNE